ncbi:hypothetical protein BDA99DRAFT_520808 [Phascolomyces articulosus]|uniref:Uncharacterized protein n=1 Tax=Phascolomyces articulosus TaxID=60185 RepID=A0AAD5PBU8_9FUNG|nr:hypothetical protein BDA99DRAFT_520808 [Phascolomyces articulosus]
MLSFTPFHVVLQVNLFISFFVFPSPLFSSALQPSFFFLIVCWTDHFFFFFLLPPHLHIDNLR